MQPISPLAAFGRPTNGSAIPPIPDLTDFIGIYSQNGIAAGWQNNSALITAAGDDSSDGILSTASAPYPLDWASPQWATIGANPRVNTWYDQSAVLGDAADGGGGVPSIDVGGESFDWIAVNTDGLIMANNLPSSITALTIFIAVDVTTFDQDATLLQLSPYTGFGTERQTFTIRSTVAGSHGTLFAGQSGDSSASDINSKAYALPSATSGKQLLTVIFDRTAAVADQTKMWLNGVSVGTADGTVDMASSDFTSSLIGIGYGDSQNTGLLYFDGSMSNVWIATGAFNDTRRQTVEAFLAQITGTSLG